MWIREEWIVETKVKNQLLFLTTIFIQQALFLCTQTPVPIPLYFF